MTTAMHAHYKAYGNYDEFCERACRMPFSEYIQYCQSYIKNIRELAGLSADADTIAMNSPFEMRPDNYDGKNAILLIHGYLASPYLMRAIGAFFHQQGYLVRAILLPGHGSSPGELCAATLEHWQSAVNYGIQSLQTEANQIHLAGYSLGATLASLAAFNHPIASLSMFSPAHRITPFANLLPLFSLLNRLTRLNVLAWLAQEIQDDLVTYRSYPSSSVIQVQKAVTKLQQQLRKQSLQIPCFIAATLDDSTVSAKETLSFFKRHNNPNSRMLLYTRKAKQFPDSRITVIASASLEKQVRELSHVSIPIAPEDPYYGRNGKYYGEVKLDTIYGEKTLFNAKNKNYRRLTYHPAFKPMLEALKTFLNNLTK